LRRSSNPAGPVELPLDLLDAVDSALILPELESRVMPAVTASEVLEAVDCKASETG
jgi:hypothetical protein